MIALLAAWGLAALFLCAVMAAAWGVQRKTGQGGWADLRPTAIAACTTKITTSATTPLASDEPVSAIEARSEPVATVVAKSNEDILEKLRSPLMRTTATIASGKPTST